MLAAILGLLLGESEATPAFTGEVATAAGSPAGAEEALEVYHLSLPWQYVQGSMWILPPPIPTPQRNWDNVSRPEVQARDWV